MTDSTTLTHAPKAQPGTPEYKRCVAEPVMRAVDALPRSYRALVHEYGYVDVYRAWRRGWSVTQIVERARNGAFAL